VKAATVTTAPTRRGRVLAHLAEHPGLTASELGRVLGLARQIDALLRRMEDSAEITATRRWAPHMGRLVRHWQVAPPGTVPPDRPVSRESVRNRLERDRRSQRARRARARGLQAPSLRSVGTGAPDLPGAACAGADPDLFFPPDHYEDPPARHRRERQAKAFCAGCPVRRRCFDLADARGERHGIFGGVDFGDRRKKARAS
jgi:Transcription factor WhiB